MRKIKIPMCIKVWNIAGKYGKNGGSYTLQNSTECSRNEKGGWSEKDVPAINMRTT